MTRRGDPDRTYQAQRAGVLARLTQNERVEELDAEHWIARWEREAEATGRARGSSRYWDDGWDWIASQRADPNVPKTDMSAEGDDGQVFGG